MKFFGPLLKFKCLVLGFAIFYGVSCSSPQAEVSTIGEIASSQVEAAEAKSKNSKRSRKKAKKKSRKVAGKKRKRKKRKKVDFLNSKPIRKIRKTQAKRFDKILYFKGQFFIGEMDNGLLGIRPSARMPATTKSKVTALVRGENLDREKLYVLIAKENKYDKKQTKILRTQFFETYRNWDPRGAYFAIDRAWQN